MGLAVSSIFNRHRGSIMSDILEFAGREEFRKWLGEHCQSDNGVWLLFGKAGGRILTPRQRTDEKSGSPGWWTGLIKI